MVSLQRALRGTAVVVTVAVGLSGCAGKPATQGSRPPIPTSVPTTIAPGGDPIMTKLFRGEGCTAKVPMGWVEKKFTKGGSYTWDSADEKEQLGYGLMDGPLSRAEDELRRKEPGVQLHPVTWPGAKAAALYTFTTPTGSVVHGLLAEPAHGRVIAFAAAVQPPLVVADSAAYQSLRSLRLT